MNCNSPLRPRLAFIIVYLTLTVASRYFSSSSSSGRRTFCAERNSLPSDASFIHIIVFFYGTFLHSSYRGEKRQKDAPHSGTFRCGFERIAVSSLSSDLRAMRVDRSRLREKIARAKKKKKEKGKSECQARTRHPCYRFLPAYLTVGGI